MLDPDIVLFDEPDSGLDPVRTALLCELIKEIHDENGGAYVVITHALPPGRTLLVIGAAAVLQILVHLRFFLHINFTTTPKENLLAISFTAVLIFLMVGGSLWIMIDLHQRMAI